MSLYTFFGCLLVAYGPILSIFFLYIGQNAQHVLLMVSRRSEAGLNIVSANPHSPFNQSIFSFVTGYGYALTTTLVSYISLLVESIGPGVIMCPSCPQATTFFISAVTTSLFSLLHIVWMMVAFEGFSNIRKPSGIARVIWVIGSHFGASYATLLNGSETIQYGCVYSIITCIGILSISTALVAYSLKSRYQLHSHPHSS
ncbi:Aph-1 protein-domain-containing protein [Phascolomyces articulosus]|uniref:Aph-1 protein-domain-containing protein n=1 Tax=Phascolomyces articulosus TaxID=60185 RepID=A0AAD5PAX6_9FUNG|nr:Aph-1 protein-domain-containing protein [Phascolomyces articulosus]